jgi:hypothetical protein
MTLIRSTEEVREARVITADAALAAISSETVEGV